MSETQDQQQPQEPQAQQPQQPTQELQQQKAIPAVGFLVAAFLEETAADEALDAMKEAKKQGKFYFEEAAVIRQDAQGKVSYHETGEMGGGKGAGIGALVGGVLGILGGPAGVVIGASAGAAVGAVIGGKDRGFRNESLGTVGVALKPGTSAVVAITSHDFLMAVQQRVPIEQTRATVANLAAELSRRLGEKKNVAIGMLLTEDGVGIREIAANENSAEVVGAVITSEVVVVASAVVTPEGAAYQAVAATKEGVVAEAGVVTEEGGTIVQAYIPAQVAASGEPAAPEASALPAEPEGPKPEK